MLCLFPSTDFITEEFMFSCFAAWKHSWNILVFFCERFCFNFSWQSKCFLIWGFPKILPRLSTYLWSTNGFAVLWPYGTEGVTATDIIEFTKRILIWLELSGRWSLCFLLSTGSSDAKCDPDFLKERTVNVLRMSKGYMEPHDT